MSDEERSSEAAIGGGGVVYAPRGMGARSAAKTHQLLHIYYQQRSTFYFIKVPPPPPPPVSDLKATNRPRGTFEPDKGGGFILLHPHNMQVCTLRK
jgi:hypothetical protein